MKKKRTAAQLAADTHRTGRPPKPSREHRTERVVVRVTKQQRARLEAQARRAGSTVAAYILRLLSEKGV